MHPALCFFKSCQTVTTKTKSAPADDADEITRKNLVRVRTQFLRNMSHRIDTDMIHRLTQSSSKFREISDRSSIPEFVGTIFDVGQEYGAMMNNVLKYYDCVNEKFRAVDGPMLIRNVLSDATTDAKQQMMRVSKVPALVTVDIRHDVPVSEMIGDGPVIKECLQELIFNGLRHDNDTHVSVHVTAMSHDPCHVTFAVEDRGIQIEDEDLPTMFTAFHSIHRGIVHGSGLGIGLAKCKRMVHALGGDIRVENGEVTVFSMVLPLRHEKDFRVHPDGMSFSYVKRPSVYRTGCDATEESYIFQTGRISPTATRPSILVVDDSFIARKQFEKMMSYVDIDVDLCDGSRKCLELVKTKTYDIVCLDIIMPVMSGITCAHHIREGGTANKNSPIVVITADNSVETRQLCACIPNSTVLEKPAKRNVLLRTIMSSMQGSPQKEWVRKAWHEKNTNLPDNIDPSLVCER